jgi:tRNA threonylcarbamoyladenosine biosynthesis protein TsaE
LNRGLASNNMAARIYKLKNLEDTGKLAVALSHKLRGGDVVALSGKLGAGKTTFTQLLSKALGVKDDVKSPTFNIMHLHKISKSAVGASTFCHVDCYRLKETEELEAIGFFDHLTDSKTITVVEWAEKIKPLLPPHTLWLKFKLTASGRTVSQSLRRH